MKKQLILEYMKYNPKTNNVIWRGTTTNKKQTNLWGFSIAN